MSKTNRFIVWGQPIPKARPRHNFKTGNTYTPQNTRDAEKDIANSYLLAGYGVLEGDIGIVVNFYRETKRTADIDNLFKTVTDALNGVAYKDDSQIRFISAVVSYGNLNPRTEVDIFRLEDVRIDVRIGE